MAWLARAGSEVVLTARSEAKGQEAVDRILRQIPQAKVRFGLLDLASLDSVRAFAASMSHEAWLDLLGNNAGVMALPERQVTKDGLEMQVRKNHLGAVALALLLLLTVPRASPAPAAMGIE